jgi:predicted ATPase
VAAEEWGEVGPLRVRMALHTGAAQSRDDDYFGPTLNRVARVLSTGYGGQILLSVATVELVRDSLPAATSLQDLGEHALKDLLRPEHVYQLSIPDLPTDFPALKSLSRHPHNLPVQPTPFLGRQQEVERVNLLLQHPEVRLVTLTGPGGMGKTRLSLQVAAELSDAFADGVFLVALAAVSQAELVVPTIVQTLGLHEVAGQSVLSLLKSTLKDKQLLLVLDNFEQVVESAVQIAELLAACPRLKLLVTSRILLHVQAEREFAVPPLSLPNPRHLPDLVTLSQYEAVALFIQRAQAVKAEFSVTNANAPAVAEICTRLDGLPLAIELAAARVKFFAPPALLTRLEQGLSVLTGGARDLPARQQTLRGAIAWSYDLLSPQEQALFRRLAVFVDGWTPDAAEVVCWAAGELEIDVLDGLLSLVDKSLLRQQELEQGEPRFWMLQLLREFGLEALTKAGESEVTRRVHAEYFLRLSEEAEPELSGPNQAAWTQRLEQEHDNLRAALGWTREQREQECGLRLAGALHTFWFRRGHLSEGRQWLSTLLAREHPVAAAVRAKALRGAGYLALRQGDASQARALLEESLALYREVGDKGGIAYALLELSGPAWRQDDYGQVRALLEESLALFRELGDKVGLARSLGNLGMVDGVQEDYSQARTLFEESLGLFRELGHKYNIAWALGKLGVLARLEGDYGQAKALLKEGLSLSSELGVKDSIAWALVELGVLARLEGDYGQAKALLKEGLSLFRELGNKSGLAWVLAELGTLARLEGDYSQARALLEESLTLRQELGDKEGIASCLEGLAEGVRVQGDPGRAVRLFGAAQALRLAIGAPLPPVERAAYEQAVASVRAQLGEDAFAAAWQEGRATELSQIIEQALKTGDETSKKG